jgi:hypothetical protein
MINSITQSIKNYLDMKNAHSAIMLTGEWGCGKSFYVKNNLKEDLKEKTKVIYISLYGLDKVEDINNAVRKQYLSSLGNTILSFNEETEDKPKSKELFKKAFGGLSAFIPGGEIISKVAGSIGGSIIELLQATEITPEINGKQVLLVFDDFERSTIDIQVLMGVINEYAENNKVKVLVVANEKEIKDKEGKPKQDNPPKIKDNEKVDKTKTTYEHTKEKFIFQTIAFKGYDFEDFIEIPKILYSEYKDYSKFLSDSMKDIKFTWFSAYCHKLTERIKELKNIRTLIYSTELFKNIYDKIDNNYFTELNDTDTKKALFRLFYFTCIEFKSGKDIIKDGKVNYSIGHSEKLAHQRELPLGIRVYIIENDMDMLLQGLKDLNEKVRESRLHTKTRPIDRISSLYFTYDQWEECIDAIKMKMEEKRYKLYDYCKLLIKFHINDTKYFLLPTITAEEIKNKIDFSEKMTDTQLRIVKEDVTKENKDSEYKKLLEEILEKLTDINTQKREDKITRYLKGSIEVSDFKDIIDFYNSLTLEFFDFCDQLRIFYQKSKQNMYENSLETVTKYLETDGDDIPKRGTVAYARFHILKGTLEECLNKESEQNT